MYVGKGPRKQIILEKMTLLETLRPHCTLYELIKLNVGEFRETFPSVSFQTLYPHRLLTRAPFTYTLFKLSIYYGNVNYTILEGFRYARTLM